jgi:hypothetical protein
MFKARLQSSILAIVLVSILSSGTIYAQSNQRPEYLQCMQQAVQDREDASLQLRHNYDEERIRLLENRAQDFTNLWVIDNDRDRRDEERRIERDYREALRDIERQYDDSEDEIRNGSRAAERECNDLRKQLAREERDAARAEARTTHNGDRYFSDEPALRPRGNEGIGFGGFFEDGPICGDDPWTLEGLGLVWDDLPIRVCVL